MQLNGAIEKGVMFLKILQTHDYEIPAGNSKEYPYRRYYEAFLAEVRRLKKEQKNA